MRHASNRKGQTMNRKEAERLTRLSDTLQSLGFSRTEAESLRRISMTLHRWYERECGTDGGCIERGEKTGRAYWLDSTTGRRWAIPDRENGARKRLANLMANHAPLSYYLQTDPRGAALYILRPGDVPEGKDPDAYYSRGICVY